MHKSEKVLFDVVAEMSFEAVVCEVDDLQDGQLENLFVVISAFLVIDDLLLKLSPANINAKLQILSEFRL